MVSHVDLRQPDCSYIQYVPLRTIIESCFLFVKCSNNLLNTGRVYTWTFADYLFHLKLLSRPWERGGDLFMRTASWSSWFIRVTAFLPIWAGGGHECRFRKLRSVRLRSTPCASLSLAPRDVVCCTSKFTRGLNLACVAKTASTYHSADVGKVVSYRKTPLQKCALNCGAKRQARLREQILGLLGLGLLPDNYPVGRYDHIIR